MQTCAILNDIQPNAERQLFHQRLLLSTAINSPHVAQRHGVAFHPDDKSSARLPYQGSKTYKICYSSTNAKRGILFLMDNKQESIRKGKNHPAQMLGKSAEHKASAQQRLVHISASPKEQATSFLWSPISLPCPTPSIVCFLRGPTGSSCRR